MSEIEKMISRYLKDKAEFSEAEKFIAARAYAAAIEDFKDKLLEIAGPVWVKIDKKVLKRWGYHDYG
jgi:hypothetical protein